MRRRTFLWRTTNPDELDRMSRIPFLGLDPVNVLGREGVLDYFALSNYSSELRLNAPIKHTDTASDDDDEGDEDDDGTLSAFALSVRMEDKRRRQCPSGLQ